MRRSAIEFGKRIFRSAKDQRREGHFDDWRVRLSLCCAVGGLALILIISFPIFSAHQQTAQPVWRLQSSGVLAKLNAVHFVDRQHGWAAGNNGTLLATDGGGEKWRRVALPEYERREPVLDVWMFDGGRGCLLGEYGVFDRRPEIEPGKRVFLLHSENGGASWRQNEFARLPVKPTRKKPPKENNTDKDPDNDKPEVYPDPVLLRMFFVNKQVGWACGELGAIQTTSDGGATWRMLLTGSLRIFYDVTAVDEKQVWVAGAAGIVLHTVDGGQNWHEQLSGVTQALRAIRFVDAKLGWAAGANGAILSTTNGGNRWQKQDSGTSVTLNDLFFVSAREGWAAGDRGTLLHTTDGGTTWQDESLKTHANLNRLFFIAPDRGWVVGGNGIIFSFQE
jgi:photosystem II stability/assembly factor-like uncharacterized protein